MTKLTDTQLHELLVMEEKATPGPWQHEKDSSADRGTGLIWQTREGWEPGVYFGANVKTITRCEYISTGWNARPDEEADNNAEFIAQSRSTIRPLILELLAAREVIDTCKRARQEFMDRPASDLMDEIFKKVADYDEVSG